VSPYNQDREQVRSLLEIGGRKDFIEIYVQASVSTCEERDPKGLYAKARAGEIPNFTGISAPFEEPINPDVILKTGDQSVEECVALLMKYLKDGGYLSAHKN
jgi:adenylylsulfate kinase